MPIVIAMRRLQIGPIYKENSIELPSIQGEAKEKPSQHPHSLPWGVSPLHISLAKYRGVPLLLVLLVVILLLLLVVKGT
jgi:hypothetical protein